MAVASIRSAVPSAISVGTSMVAILRPAGSVPTNQPSEAFPWAAITAAGAEEAAG